MSDKEELKDLRAMLKKERDRSAHFEKVFIKWRDLAIIRVQELREYEAN